MATVVRSDLVGCEGFRLESSEGLLGWIEETWLDASNEPVAFAIRTVDGREGLLRGEDVDAVTRDFELVTMRGKRACWSSTFRGWKPPRATASRPRGARPASRWTHPRIPRAPSTGRCSRSGRGVSRRR